MYTIASTPADKLHVVLQLISANKMLEFATEQLLPDEMEPHEMEVPKHFSHELYEKAIAAREWTLAIRIASNLSLLSADMYTIASTPDDKLHVVLQLKSAKEMLEFPTEQLRKQVTSVQRLLALIRSVYAAQRKVALGGRARVCLPCEGPVTSETR